MPRVRNEMPERSWYAFYSMCSQLITNTMKHIANDANEQVWH